MNKPANIHASSHSLDHGWIPPEFVAGLISFVVPTHNRADLLEETLNSIIAQTYSPIEIIVVDDGSTDETEATVNAIAASLSDGRELVYHRQDSAGGPVARNTGAKLTKGEFIVFMDDDDVIPTQFLQVRIAALRSNPGTNFAFGLWHVFDVLDGEHRIHSTLGKLPTNVEFDWYSFISGEWQLLLQGCLMQRDLVCQTGPWDTALLKSQDLEYKARLLSLDSCRKVFVEDQPVYYRLHRKSISGIKTSEKMDSYVDVVDQLEAMTLARSDYDENAGQMSEFLWYHSFWLYGVGEIRRGYRQLLRAKTYDKQICQTKGFAAKLLDTCGLDFLIGTMYYQISRCKKWLGFSKPRILKTYSKLPLESNQP